MWPFFLSLNESVWCQDTYSRSTWQRQVDCLNINLKCVYSESKTCLVHFYLYQARYIIYYLFSLLLGHLLFTLGSVMQAASSYPMAPVMAAALLDFCWAIISQWHVSSIFTAYDWLGNKRFVCRFVRQRDLYCSTCLSPQVGRRWEQCIGIHKNTVLSLCDCLTLQHCNNWQKFKVSTYHGSSSCNSSCDQLLAQFQGICLLGMHFSHLLPTWGLQTTPRWSEMSLMVEQLPAACRDNTELPDEQIYIQNVYSIANAKWKHYSNHRQYY